MTLRSQLFTLDSSLLTLNSFVTSAFTLRRSLAAPLVAALLGVPLAGPAAAQAPATPRPEGYTLGSGIPLGRTGVRLGGYLTLEFENPAADRAELLFDDLSLFVFGDIGSRFRFFLEAEESHFWAIDSAGHVEARNNPDVERLYVDYLQGDLLKVRLGKFLTPIGTWNEIHPDPLTWTVSRPVASYATFPAFTTGLQVFGTWAAADRDVDYVVFLQRNEALDRSTGDRATERMVGGRVRVRQGRVEVGVPLVRYTERATGDVVIFSGADLVARAGRLEARGEATAGRVRALDKTTRTEYAGYLQGLVSITDRLFVVGRVERARSRDDLTYRAASAGLLVRPRPAVSLKLEFQGRSGGVFTADPVLGRQVLASFGLLF